MKAVLVCFLFGPIIYFALKEKKWYLYLLVAFFGILPEQFSIRVHENLPLLSVSRVLVIISFLFWLYDRWKKRDFSFPVSLLIFLVINVAISAINLRYGLGEIKRVFLFIFERVLLATMLMDMIENRNDFDRCIDFMIMGCCAVSLMGIVQTVFEYDIASVLHITKTQANLYVAPRMGLIRAYGTKSAIPFGCYLAFMMLPIYYRIEKTARLSYSAAFALCFMALICTFSRSSWMPIGALFILLFLLRRGQMIKKIFPACGMILALCAVLCCIQPKLGKAILETTKSSLNTALSIIPQSNATIINSTDANTIDESVTKQLSFELSSDFGLNAANPSYTRLAQWTAVEYMIGDGEALFGYGYNAYQKGRLHVFYDRWMDQWGTMTFLDVGLVGLLTESGFVGALSYLGLLAFLWRKSFKGRKSNGEFDFTQVTLYIIPLYFVLNFLSAILHVGVVWLIWGLSYCNLRFIDGDSSVQI